MALIDEFNEDDLDLSQFGISMPDETEVLVDDAAPDLPLDDESHNNTQPQVRDDRPTRAEFETLASQNAELIKMLKEQNSRPIYVNPAPQQQQLTPEQIAAQRALQEQQYYANPLETTQRLAQQAAQSQFGGLVQDMRETLARQSVQSYKQRMLASEPAFSAASEHFDAQLARLPQGNLGNLNAQQLQEFLETVKDAAYGKVMQQVLANSKKKGNTQRQQEVAPSYGGGGRSGATGRQPVLNQEAALAKRFGLTQADFDGIIE